MKILVITSTYSRWQGDTEPKFVDNLCNYLARDNEVHVIAPHAPGIPRREEMDGIPVYRFKYCLERWQSLAYDGGILPSLKENKLRVMLIPLFILSQYLLTMSLLRRNDYDVIHAHWIVPQGLVAVLARATSRSRPAVVLTSHGGDLFALRGRLLTVLKKWITSRADHLTVVSSAMKKRAVELDLVEEENISSIPMGMDSHGMFLPPDPVIDRQKLLFVGRLVDKKGIEYLLDAMPHIIDRHPEQSLTIVGEGPLKQALQEQCARRGISEKVTFTGSVVNTEIPGYLQASIVTVFPSVVTDSGDQEGTPVAIMEALSCACATVVSDYPGARDIIHDGENGTLVAQRSSEQIAEAVIDLLDHPEKRRRFGEEGRRSVQRNYDWRVISGKFLSLFDSLGSEQERRG